MVVQLGQPARGSRRSRAGDQRAGSEAEIVWPAGRLVFRKMSKPDFGWASPVWLLKRRRSSGRPARIWKPCAPMPPTTNVRRRGIAVSPRRGKAPRMRPPSLQLRTTPASFHSTADWQRSRHRTPPVHGSRDSRVDRGGLASSSVGVGAAPAHGAPPGQSPAASKTRIFAVSDLVRAARLTLESRFSDVHVEGEVSGLKRSANGHLYFTLKDAEAQLDCVMYAREAARLRFRLQDGQQARCRAVSPSTKRAAASSSPSTDRACRCGSPGPGLRATQAEAGSRGSLRSGTQASPALSAAPAGCGDSAQGAVIRDIVRVAHRRFPVPILLAPTPVQGEGAAAAIAAAWPRS